MYSVDAKAQTYRINGFGGMAVLANRFWAKSVGIFGSSPIWTV